MTSNAPGRVRLCILENGLVSDELIKSFSSYPQMTERWLSPLLPEAEFAYLSPVTGDGFPHPQAFDGYLLTGSRHSAYEKTDWMQTEISFLQQLCERQIPVFGICFGHQIMADAFGGLTTRSEKGWGVGAQNYHYRIPGLPDEAPAFIFHQDQVTRLPADAICLGGSDHCPNGILRYQGFPAMSVQFHPEFTLDYMEALVSRNRGISLGTEEADSALASLKTLTVRNEQIGRWVATFFRDNMQKEGQCTKKQSVRM